MFVLGFLCIGRLARIVEDDISFSSVKRRMAEWREESRKRRKVAAEELLCSGILEAAVEKSAEDDGQGFDVCTEDVQTALGFDKKMYDHLFKGKDVSIFAPWKSESVQAFQRSFGYQLGIDASWPPSWGFEPVETAP